MNFATSTPQRKETQLEIKDTLTEMKNNSQGIDSRIDDANNQISDLEYKKEKNTQSEQQKDNFSLNFQIYSKGKQMHRQNLRVWGHCGKKADSLVFEQWLSALGNCDE